MLKRKAFNRIFLTTVIFFIVFVLYIFMNDSFPSNGFSNGFVSGSYVYTLNEDNYISKASVYVSKSLSLEDEIRERLEIITDENNKNSLLPSYFKPILPKNTEVLDVVIEDGIVKLYFSKELYDISAYQAEKMIESIIYTISDDDILGIELYADGEMVKYVPHTDKMLPTILTRDFGINKVYDIRETSSVVKVVMTYYGKFDGIFYEIPVTRYVNSDVSKLQVIVDNLDGMVSGLNLISMVDEVELVDYKISSGCIFLVFDRELSDDEKKIIKSSVMANYDVNEVLFGVS